jgi:hypothetical protein
MKTRLVKSEGIQEMIIGAKTIMGKWELRHNLQPHRSGALAWTASIKMLSLSAVYG